MSHVLHIFRKDVRRLRWALLVWIAVIVLRLALRTAGAELSFGTLGAQIAVSNASELLLFIEILLLAVIVSGLVHDEPLVGADAFWLTRPIGGRTLLTAKLFFAALLLVVLPAAGESIVMAAVSADPQVALRAAPEYAFNQALWVALLMALATVTPSLMRFLLALIGSVMAVAILVTILVGLFLVFANLDDNTFIESMVTDRTSGIVATLLVMCAALLAVVYQYRHRRTGRAVAIGVIGIVVAVIIADNWPWHFARPAEPDPGVWAQDAGRTAAVLEPGAAPRTSDERGLNRNVSRKTVAAPIRLDGAPADYSADQIATRTRIEFPDGTALESAQTRDMPIDLPVAGRPGRTERIQSALGSARLLSTRRFNAWPAILNVTDEAYERYGGVPGRLTATVYFFMYRSTLMGALPLAERASLRDGPRIEVLRVLRRSGGCTILVRQTGAGSVWKPSVPTQYDFALRNAGRGEAVLGVTQVLRSPAPSIASALIPGGIAVGNESPGSGFVFLDMVTEFPARESGADAPALDSAWLDGADLAVIETTYAGRVSRTLTIDGFRMR
jgi:hypothetical protein